MTKVSEPAFGAKLEACGLRRTFGRRTVVQGIDFVVHPGEVVGLLGANGAGKTTTFNMVAGLLRSDGGSVRLGGVDMQGLPLYRRAQLGLGYLPQESSVFVGLTVADNIRVVCEAKRLRKPAAEARVAEVLRRYNLMHLASARGRDLSGGERRRLEMARAWAACPKVMLLDEPFAGVDPIATSLIKSFIRAICDDGVGVLITDHNVRETLAICDRAYLLDGGKILVHGTPHAIVADPLARQTYLGDDFRL